MDRKTTNQRLADALGGAERSMEQLRYKAPTTASAKLLQSVLEALDHHGKVEMTGTGWVLEFQPVLRQRVRQDNSIFLIRPYRYGGIWVFDDPARNLVREPFVDETQVALDRLTAEVPRAEDGFNLRFSASGFPGADLILNRLRGEFGGWWYGGEALGTEVWLGEPVYGYFGEAPEQIYLQIKP